MLLYQGKYKKLFSFALMFEKFSLKKQNKHVKRNIRNFDLQALQVPSWNVRSLLSMRLERPISWNIRNFVRVGLFYFASPESSLLKYKKSMTLKIPISGNIRNFLILELESSISWNMRNFFGVDFLKIFRARV